jgi:hypothetical protein
MFQIFSVPERPFVIAEVDLEAFCAKFRVFST